VVFTADKLWFDVVQDKVIAMPDCWRALEKHESMADLCERARKFLIFSQGNEFEDEAHETLQILGEGFTCLSRIEDSYQCIRENTVIARSAMAAMNSLLKDFQGRVSSVVWVALASLLGRQNPLKEESIIRLEAQLPYPFWLIDAIIHALGKVYLLSLHVQSRIFQYTGLIFDHNCDCNHALKPLKTGKISSVFLPKGQIRTATAALFTHILCETFLIRKHGLPFALGVSSEMQELQKTHN
jgi:hypothetical protein